MANTLNLYEKLQASPLFAGLTGDNILQIIGQTKFSFNKYHTGQTIKREGEQCLTLTFLISGSATSITYADDYGYSVEEHFDAPHILQPERLFGLTQRYSKSFRADSTCDTLSIGKNDILRLSDEFLIFRLNLINIVSAISQKAERAAWHSLAGSDDERVLRFFRTHIIKLSGPKTIRIKMTRLAAETNESRLAVSKQLNRLQQLGLLKFSRGIITIPAYEKLLAR